MPSEDIPCYQASSKNGAWPVSIEGARRRRKEERFKKIIIKGHKLAISSCFDIEMISGSSASIDEIEGICSSALTQISFLPMFLWFL